MNAPSKLNRDWHRAHKMPRNPTPAQRAVWHLEHSRQCGCRALTPSIRRLIETELPGRSRSSTR